MKWWWHELALVKEIGLEGKETATARELLASVVAEAKEMAPSSFTCKEQRYGAAEEFVTTTVELATNVVVKATSLSEIFEG
jgi:hypothetical protein